MQHRAFSATIPTSPQRRLGGPAAPLSEELVVPNVVAMILAGGRVDELSVLTLHRPKSAVPFGGMYRVIDFPLSNLMHSAIEQVGILSQYRSYSLIHHIGVGASWDLIGRNRGATILPPQKGVSDTDWYRGTADAVYQNLEFLDQHDPDLVLVLSGDHIYRMDYQPMIELHLREKADATIGFVPVAREQAGRFGLGKIDGEGEEGGRLLDYVEKPEKPEYTWASMTVYLFRSELLIRVVSENARKGTSWEFGRDIIPELIRSSRVFAYRHHGYWGYTRTVDEYWRCNMDLLGENPAIPIEEWDVRTNLDNAGLRDRGPAHFHEGSTVTDSRISSGCRISGTVSHSILFPGCCVAKGAVVRDSILFSGVQVEKGAVLDRVVCDERARIERGAHVGCGDDLTPNRAQPDLLRSGINLVGKKAVVPAGLRIERNCIVGPNTARHHFSADRIRSGDLVS